MVNIHLALGAWHKDRRAHIKIFEHGQQIAIPKRLVSTSVLIIGIDYGELLPSVFKSWVGFPAAQRQQTKQTNPKASLEGTEVGYPMVGTGMSKAVFMKGM